MSRSLALPVLVALLAAPTAPATGEMIPLGAPVDVAPTDHYSSESRPRVCADPSGAFVVSWLSGSRVFARRFARGGEPLSEPFFLFDTNYSRNGPPEIACLPSGTFVAVWVRPKPDFSEYELVARTLTAGGTNPDQPVRIDQHGYVNQQPRIACGSSGCVVTWLREAPDTGYDAVLARRLGPDGTPVGPEIPVASSSFDQGYADVALAPDGSFFVSWTWSTNSQVGVQPFLPDGSPDTTAILIRPFDGFSSGFAFNSIARSPEGSLLIAWGESLEAGAETMFYSVLRPDGSLAVDRERVDPRFGIVEIAAPAAVPDAGGGFVLVWGDMRDDRVVGRQLTAAGSSRGPAQVLAEPARTPHTFSSEIDVESRFDGSLALAWKESDPYGFDENRVSLFRTSSPLPPVGPWLASAAVPGYSVKVRFSTPSGSLVGAREPGCIAETICVSGAIPGRSEVFARVVGPKPNGFLWPTLVKFSTAQVEAWVRQDATDEVRYYVLEGARPGFDELPGLFDRTGFEPVGAALVDSLFASDPVVLAAGNSAPPPAVGAIFTSEHFPDFRFRVRITSGGQAQEVRLEDDCIEETVCLSGAVPGRSEIFLRVVGPKPNGRLWPTIVKFTTSKVEVWVEQISTATTKYYAIEGAAPGRDELTGLFDRQGFTP